MSMDQLREAIENSKRSQRQIAEDAGINATIISNLMLGKDIDFRYSTLTKLYESLLKHKEIAKDPPVLRAGCPESSSFSFCVSGKINAKKDKVETIPQDLYVRDSASRAKNTANVVDLPKEIVKSKGMDEAFTVVYIVDGDITDRFCNGAIVFAEKGIAASELKDNDVVLLRTDFGLQLRRWKTDGKEYFAVKMTGDDMPKRMTKHTPIFAVVRMVVS